MGTLAEDIERTRALYNSIKTPWKRPRFPDPPTEFLAPEKFLELAKEAVLVHHTKINHPFCVKLFRGEWTVKQLHGWIKQEYHAVMQTLRNDANIVANAECFMIRMFIPFGCHELTRCRRRLLEVSPRLQGCKPP